MRVFFYCIALTFSVVSLNASANEAVLFRYVNEQGSKVIGYTIPPEYIPKGYEILNSQGMLIEVVPPELSPEEKRKLIEQEREQKRLAQWDALLRNRYSSVEDIYKTKERQLAKIDLRISSLNNEVAAVNQEIEKKQAEAAAQERRNQTVSPELNKEISALFEHRENLKARIVETQENYQQQSDSYDKEAARYKILEQEKTSSEKKTDNPAEESTDRETTSITNQSTKLDCKKAVSNAKDWIDSMLEVGERNQKGGYMNQSEYKKISADLKQMKNKISISECSRATGEVRAFYECMSDGYTHIAQCGKEHNYGS